MIINGDDFGMNGRCSRAIAQAMREGLITDTTMMANGAYFDEAVTLAHEQGFCDRIGIHFNLTEGAPLTDGIGKLHDFVRGGMFHKGYSRRPHPLIDEERELIYCELSAQVERLERAGITLTHADSHHYIHNFTYLAPIVAQVCREHGIRKVRLNRTFDTPALPCITENRIHNAWWREQGFVTTEHFGRLSDIGDAALASLEIMVHPDFDRNGVLIDRTGIKDGLPVGVPLTDFLRGRSVVLTSYRDL